MLKLNDQPLIPSSKPMWYLCWKSPAHAPIPGRQLEPVPNSPILHITFHAYYAYFTYYFAYCIHIIFHIILHIMHIIIDAYCAYSAYCNMHILHIMHIHNEKFLL